MAARTAARSRGKIYRLGVFGGRYLLQPNMAHTSLGIAQRAARPEVMWKGRNLVIEYRSADGNPERFAGLAAELGSP